MFNDSIKQYDEFLYKLPAVVLSAKKGVGSFLLFDLGGKKFSEKYTLWIYLCDWEIYIGNDLALDSSEEDGEVVNGVVSKFVDEGLVEIIEGSESNFRLQFTNNMSVNLFVNKHLYEKEDDVFMLCLERGGTVAFSLDKGIYFEDD